MKRRVERVRDMTERRGEGRGDLKRKERRES